MNRLTRQLGLFVIFMTGEVPSFTPKQVEEMREDWNKKSKGERMSIYADLKESASNRRLSMTENSHRGSLVFSALGLAFALAVFGLPNAQCSDLIFTRVSVALYVVAAVLVLWMSSPKLKLFKYEDREPAGIRKLKEHSDPFGRYVELANVRKHRDMITFVERRALLMATLSFIFGLVINTVVLLG